MAVVARRAQAEERMPLRVRMAAAAEAPAALVLAVATARAVAVAAVAAAVDAGWQAVVPLVEPEEAPPTAIWTSICHLCLWRLAAAALS